MNPYNPTPLERAADDVAAVVLAITMVAIAAFQAGKFAESVINPFDGEMQDYTVSVKCTEAGHRCVGDDTELIREAIHATH